MRNVRDYSYLAVLALCMVVGLLLISGCQEEKSYPKESIAKAGGSDKDAQLIYAAKGGNLSAVQTLLADGADINAKDTIYGTTVLMWAAAKGHSEVVELLLEKGTEVNAALNDGRTALWQASWKGRTEIVKLLLTAGADVDAKGEFSLGVRWDTGWSGWSTDAQSIVAETMKKSREAALNASSKTKTVHVTPLFMASRNGHIEVVKLLLEAGADVNFEVKDADGESCTPYIMAKEMDRKDIMQLLKKAGAKESEADVSDNNTESAKPAKNANEDKDAQLLQAAKYGNLPAVQALLANGADVNAKETTYGATALIIASQNGHTEIVKLLLEKGADVNAKVTTYGAGALYAASQNGHTEVVKLLLEKGADVNVKQTVDGTTALMVASQNGHTDVVKLLLEKGADVNVRANNGFTALGVARDAGRTDVVQLLEKAGARE